MAVTGAVDHAIRPEAKMGHLGGSPRGSAAIGKSKVYEVNQPTFESC